MPTILLQAVSPPAPPAWMPNAKRAKIWFFQRFMPVQTLFYRPILVAGAILTLALLLVLAAFIALSWRNLERVHRIQAMVSQVNRLQEIDHLLQTLRFHGSDPIRLAKLHQQLRQAELALLPEGTPTQAQLETTMDALQKLLERENARERELIAQVVADSELELEAAWAGLAGMVFLLALGAILMRYWLLLPLRQMNQLLLQLAEGLFEPIASTNTTPLWRSLIANYNQMVERLATLERARRERTRALESQVSAAARTLLAQSQNLARAERLAALGELAAGVAHELRNPLAGIRLALHNLRAECRDAQLQPRLDLIIAELERLSHHLNQLLDQARHQPEPIREVDLDRVIGETLTLLRYQIPDTIRLHLPQPTGLKILLPETGLRQALINLILNAVQAIGETGNIWVQVRQEAGYLILEVADDGPGFPEALLAHGIRPFSSGRAGGTGLGLLLVKRFATALDGRIRLSHNDPKGARVTLEIPCRTPS